MEKYDLLFDFNFCCCFVFNAFKTSFLLFSKVIADSQAIQESQNLSMFLAKQGSIR
jgi:hypothetical protein